MNASLGEPITLPSNEPQQRVKMQLDQWRQQQQRQLRHLFLYLFCKTNTYIPTSGVDCRRVSIYLARAAQSTPDELTVVGQQEVCDGVVLAYHAV